MEAHAKGGKPSAPPEAQPPKKMEVRASPGAGRRQLWAYGDQSGTEERPADPHRHYDVDTAQHLQRVRTPTDAETNRSDGLESLANRSAVPSPYISVWGKAVAGHHHHSCKNKAPQAWNRDVLQQMGRIRERVEHKPKHAKSFCCDSIGETAPAPSPKALAPLDFVNVLAFSAVGLQFAQHTRFRTLLLNEEGVSSFLAHYDGGYEWYQNQGWYATLVRYSAAYPETSKARYLANALANRYDDVFVFYSHVWLIDEDMVFPPPHHVRSFVSIAARLQAVLTQPTVEAAQSPWAVLHSNPDCAVRGTDMVDMQMPLIRTEAAAEIFGNLFPMLATSDWGLDATWCKYLEQKYGNAQPICVVANSGSFHKTVPFQRSNYSRLEAELCMRSQYKARILAHSPCPRPSCTHPQLTPRNSLHATGLCIQYAGVALRRPGGAAGDSRGGRHASL